jgi:hypothetical protein
MAGGSVTWVEFAGTWVFGVALLVLKSERSPLQLISGY